MIGTCPIDRLDPVKRLLVGKRTRGHNGTKDPIGDAFDLILDLLFS